MKIYRKLWKRLLPGVMAVTMLATTVAPMDKVQAAEEMIVSESVQKESLEVQAEAVSEEKEAAVAVDEEAEENATEDAANETTATEEITPDCSADQSVEQSAEEVMEESVEEKAATEESVAEEAATEESAAEEAATEESVVEEAATEEAVAEESAKDLIEEIAVDEQENSVEMSSEQESQEEEVVVLEDEEEGMTAKVTRYVKDSPDTGDLLFAGDVLADVDEIYYCKSYSDAIYRKWQTMDKGPNIQIKSRMKGSVGTGESVYSNWDRWEVGSVDHGPGYCGIYIYPITRGTYMYANHLRAGDELRVGEVIKGCFEVWVYDKVGGVYSNSKMSVELDEFRNCCLEKTLLESGTNKSITTPSGKWIVESIEGPGGALIVLYPYREKDTIIPVESLKENSDVYYTTDGRPKKLEYVLIPGNATEPGITWTSSNPSVATVTSDGVVKPVANGTTIVKGVSKANPKLMLEYIIPVNVESTSINKMENTDDGILLQWKSAPGDYEYLVYRKESGASKWQKITTIKQTTTVREEMTYTDTTAVNGKSYIYTVKTKSGDVYGTFESSKTIMRLAKPKFTLKNNASGVVISWDKIDKATSYAVYRKEIGAGKWSKLKELKNPNTTYTDTTAVGGKEYNYTVKAFFDGVASPHESNSSIRRLEQPKITVKNAEGGLSVTCGRVAGATNYELQRKAEWEKNWTPIAGCTTSPVFTEDIVFLDKRVSSGYKFSYRIMARNGDSRCISKTVELLYLEQPNVYTIQQNGVLRLRWQEIRGATGYRVYQKVEGGKWTVLKKCTDPFYLYYDIENPVPDVKVYYTVRAINGDCLSSFDDSVYDVYDKATWDRILSSSQKNRGF